MANVLYRRDGGRCFFSPPESPTNYPSSIGMDATLPKASERYDSFRWSWGLGDWHWGGRMPILSQVCAGQLHFTAVCLCTPSNFKPTGSLGSRIFLKKPVDQIQENFFVIALGTCRHVAYKSAQVCMHKLKDFLNKSINNADTYTYPKFVECFLISVSHSLFSLWTWPWQALSHPLGASRFFVTLKRRISWPKCWTQWWQGGWACHSLKPSLFTTLPKQIHSDMTGNSWKNHGKKMECWLQRSENWGNNATG